MSPEFCIFLAQVMTMWAPGGPQITSPRHGNLDRSKSTQQEEGRDAEEKTPERMSKTKLYKPLQVEILIHYLIAQVQTPPLL